MGAKAREKTAKSFEEEEEGFNNFEDNVEEVESSSNGSDEGENDGRDDETGMDDSGRLRLRADISLEGDEYAGKKSSRKAILEEREEDELDLENADLSQRLRVAYGVGSSDDEDDGERAIERDVVGGGHEDELDALSKEYAKLREEEERGLEILKGQERDSQQKGQAVRNQKALWDRSLEVRISLQKIFGGANRLPRKQAKLDLCKGNEQVKEAYPKLTDSAMNALDCLLDLGTLLIERNSAITQSYSSMPNGDGKREALGDAEGDSFLDRMWEKLDRFYATCVPYRDNALDRWQRKTQIYTGAVGKARLRAFNQSVSQQVAATMRDSSRLMSRMRLKRDSVHVLGQQTEYEVQKDSVASQLEDVELLQSGRAVEDDGDPETFDDSEFYQQLLREFLEQSDPSALGSMATYAHGRQHSKKRKQVDRRASKGRKLRYNVFEPLRNYMAPKPMVLPSIAIQLFSNLFGQKSETPKSTS